MAHEAYPRLVGAEDNQNWNGRSHFFPAAVEAMRRILIESFRRKHSQEHSGGHARVALSGLGAPLNDSHDELLALDEALEQLMEVDPTKANLVKLPFFAGLTQA